MKKIKEDNLKFATICSYVSLGISSGSSVFFTPYMIRMVGEGEYGVYQLIGAFVGYLTILDAGMSSAITKYVTIYRNKNQRKKEENFLFFISIFYFVISVIIMILGGGLYAKIPEMFAGSLTCYELKLAKRMFLVLLFNLIITVWGGIFRGMLNAYRVFVSVKIMEIVKAAGRIILIYFLIENGIGSMGIVISDTIFNVLAFGWCLMLTVLRIDIKARYHYFDWGQMKEVAFYSFFMFLNIVFDQLNWKVDNLVIGIKLSSVWVTIYSIGSNFAYAFLNMSVAVKGFFLPLVVEMEAKGCNENDYTEYLIKTGRLQGFLLFYVLGAFVFHGRNFITLVMGKDYYEAWLVGGLIMIGMVFPLIINAGHAILQAKNYHYIYVLVCFGVSVFNMLATWKVIDEHGIVGAALMTMLSFFIGQGLFLSLFYKKRLGINMGKVVKAILQANIFPMLPVIVFEFVFDVTYQNTWGSFLYQCVVYSGIYWISVYVMGMNDEEKKLFRKQSR